MKRVLLIACCLLPVACCLLGIDNSYASHNRAGVITYKSLGGYTYEFTIFTCTKASSPADRDYLEIFWGDGFSDTLPRVNGPDINPPNGYPDGEIIGDFTDDTKYNKYTGIHSFIGAGIYPVSVEDPNRNLEVVNMPDPFNTPFYIKTVLMINPCILPNNSPQFLYDCNLNDACVNQTYILNPNAYDPDGDSLAYKLIPCKGVGGDSIPGYRYPDEIPYGGCSASQNGVMTLNAITGDLVWVAPQCPGEYNIAILIEEWRRDTCTGNLLKIGTVIRDMQFEVVSPCSNNPPVIDDINDICVEAGDTISFTITATDTPDSNGVDDITLTASGEPLILSNDSAIFTPPPVPSSPVSGLFYWETVCQHVRTQSYQVLFRAEDNDPDMQLVDIETVQITVVGPSPENPQAIPSGNTMQLNWEQSVCSQVTGYKIYRRNGPYTGIIQCPCETGVPVSAGYSLLATTNGLTSTAFTDNNNGTGLIHGVEYCYRIVALFPDGSQSCASEEFCAELIKDVPVITHVSVGITDINSGVDTIMWSMPDEDTIKNQFPGPYHYKIYRSAGYTVIGTGTYIGSTNTDSMLLSVDTIFIDSIALNTKDTPNAYRVELYSGSNLVGATQAASSVFLSFTPSDNQLTLSWQENVPWTNTQYVVYKQDPATLLFDSIGTSSSSTYTDTGLVNATFYCYYVKSIGGYSAPGIVNPIINYSQIECAEPVDLTPPCPPQLLVNNPCEKENTLSLCDENDYKNELKWTNPNNSCADDVVKYYIYYAPDAQSELTLIDSTTLPTNTTYIHAQLFNSVAGCYAVKAVDSLIMYSFGPNQNQSGFSDTVCVDNCPVYELPNVFSPDESGINDKFTPFSPYCFIESIDIKIYNRWGQLMFESTDPEIRWDGKNQDNKKDASEGVYFYLCYVNEMRLSGIETNVLKGFIHIFRDKKISAN